MKSILQRLCDRAKAGDAAALDQLFALHSERVRMFIRAKLGNELRSDADSLDILQDAYVAALEGFAEFEWRGDDSFARWLNRIASHRIADRADRLHTQKRSPVELPRLDPSGPVTALDRSEHREKVARALERLEPDHREVILLRYFEGLDAEATGVRMQRSAGAVRKLCARALVEMEKAL